MSDVTATPSDRKDVDPTQRETEADSAVLVCMLCERWNYPWTVDELARELDRPIGVADSVERLIRAGLLHRCGEFVFPTSVARRSAELDIGGIV